MRYIIYGAGGIGAGIGGQLHKAGKEVVLIARGDHLAALQGEGLLLRTPDCEDRLRVPSVAHPRELDFRQGDVVLLTMKAQDSEGALRDLRASGGEALPVIVAQNGVFTERLAARFMTDVYAMLVLMPATYIEAGVVLLNGTPRRGTLDAGRYPSGVDPLIEAVCADLEESGLHSLPDPAVMRLKYGKLLMNVGNGVQAVCGLEAETGELTRQLRREGRACLAAAGIDYMQPRELLRHCRRESGQGEIEGVPRQGGSTWQSLLRGTGTVETDYLNGEIVLLGALHGVPTPYNRAAQEITAEAARNGEAPGSITPDEVVGRAVELGA